MEVSVILLSNMGSHHGDNNINTKKKFSKENLFLDNKCQEKNVKIIIVNMNCVFDTCLSTG